MIRRHNPVFPSVDDSEYSAAPNYEQCLFCLSHPRYHTPPITLHLDGVCMICSKGPEDEENQVRDGFLRRISEYFRVKNRGKRSYFAATLVADQL